MKQETESVQILAHQSLEVINFSSDTSSFQFKYLGVVDEIGVNYVVTKTKIVGNKPQVGSGTPLRSTRTTSQNNIQLFRKNRPTQNFMKLFLDQITINTFRTTPQSSRYHISSARYRLRKNFNKNSPPTRRETTECYQIPFASYFSFDRNFNQIGITFCCRML